MQQDTFDRHLVTACNTREKLRIATWNVRTMHQPGKLDNIKQEANRMKLDILGLAEVRWLKSGKLMSDDHMLIYSGETKDHKYGVGMLLNKRVSKSYMAHYAISSRILIVKLHCKPFDMTLVQVYAPTSSSTLEEIDAFYNDLEDAYNHCKSQDMVIIMGDLNAKVGKEQDPLRVIVGPHGLGERNERGDLWTEWCTTHDQVIMNTWFQHHQRHLYTWKSPGDGVRNQIDYITINKRFRNAVTQVKSYPGADCGSDHNPIVATLRVKLRKLQKQKSQPKLQTDLLRSKNEYRQKFRQGISKGLQEIQRIDDMETRYTAFSKLLTETTEQVVPVETRVAKQRWMTEDILEKMEERRLLKHSDTLYRQLDAEIHKDCREAKERLLSEQCELIERLDATHQCNLMHSQIRKTVGSQRGAGATTCIEDKSGNIIMDQDKILERWYEYISELYNDNSRGELPHIVIDTEGTPITQEEVEFALKRMPMKKSPGPDGVITEMLVAAGEDGLIELTSLINMVYNQGCFPEELNKSIFITLPKVSGTAKCEKHRTISLMSHITKLVLRVVMNRVRGRTLHDIAPEQYGFMPDKGTRNAIFVLRRLTERAIEKQKNIYSCFIDYSKAFDTVRHEALIDLLQTVDVDNHDVRLLANLYWTQQAAVRHNGDISEWMCIKQGVRQGCVASPHLFVLYTEMIMRSLDNMGGFRIGGKVINNLRYADDTVILAETELELQQLMDIVVEESERKGLYLNSAKSFTMVFSKSSDIPRCKIKVHGKELDQVDHFVYLGSMFTSDGRCEKEVKRRIGIAKSTFTTMKKVLCGKNISMSVRLRVLKCYVWSTLLYGCETWTLSQGMIDRLEAVEHWFLRRMMRIPWTDKVSTLEVFRRANTKQNLFQDIIRRQMQFLGHIVRKDELEKIVLTGYVEGKRDRGRQRETFLTYLSKRTGLSPIELIHQADDRDFWRQL